MEAALVSVGAGAMKPLLSKLSKLLEEEYTRLKGVRRQTEATRDEMHSMKAVFEALADVEQLDPEMISWRDDVRELSYDMEDCLDDYMARAEHKQDGSHGLRGFFDKLKKLKPRHEIAGEIEMLNARAIEASKKHKRYKIDHPTPDSITSDIDPRLHTLYVDVGKLVGIEGPKEHIVEWFKTEASSTNLPVLSIVGPGGLGKTTLVNAVYQTIKRQFSCKALVSVSRKPDMKNVLRDIAERVGITANTSIDDVRRLIDRLREHLQDKKYLIVIDDMWSAKAWKTIRDALPYNDHGSKIITTTRNSTVASFCCLQDGYVYRMKPLSSDESRSLFLQRAFGSENLCPPHLEQVCKRILKKCAGLPLAIITLSSLLAEQTAEEEWSRVLSAIGSSLAKDDGAVDMTTILSLSYFDLPQPMRTLLLYFRAFPEDHLIDKRCLIHKWIAEGFISEEHGHSRYEVGEGYFNELINRCLIQPAPRYIFDIWHYGEVLACRVHDIILDFISCKANEENFMTSFGDAEHGKKHKVRRLSVVAHDYEMVTVSGDLSHIRSLALFGSLGRDFTLNLPFLRVLDLGECRHLKSEHLANLEKLVLLRYLRLGSGLITELPKGIGKLKYLETIDMGSIEVTKLPSTMARLERLSRLYAIFQPTCLSDGIIGQLHNIEELEHVMVLDNELRKFLEELGLLTKLRTLSLTVTEQFDPSEQEDVVRFIGTLISSYNICNLHIFCGEDTCILLSLEPWCPANRTRLRKMCIPGYYIDKVPSWMMSLVNLRGLDFRMFRTEPEDLVILGAIPALSFLKLETSYGRNGRIFIRGFRSLKYFNLKLSLCGTTVEFEAGSMPKLEHLELQFRAHRLKCVHDASEFGIQHLYSLAKVDILITGCVTIYEIAERIKSALEKLRNRPTLSLKLDINNTCEHFGIALPELQKSVLDQLKDLEEAGNSHENVSGSAFCSYLGRIVEQIKQDDPIHFRALEEGKVQSQYIRCHCAPSMWIQRLGKVLPASARRHLQQMHTASKVCLICRLRASHVFLYFLAFIYCCILAAILKDSKLAKH